MKVIVKDPKSKTALRLWMPYRLGINFLLRKVWFRWALARDGGEPSKSSAWLKYVEGLDFAELRESCYLLRGYKGMTLLEVAASDGTYVHITV